MRIEQPHELGEEWSRHGLGQDVRNHDGARHVLESHDAPCHKVTQEFNSAKNEMCLVFLKATGSKARSTADLEK